MKVNKLTSDPPQTIPKTDVEIVAPNTQRDSAQLSGNNCKKLNHYAKICRSSKNVNIVQQEETVSDYLFFVTIESIDSQNRKSQRETT